jgi:hypothetical protein
MDMHTDEIVAGIPLAYPGSTCTLEMVLREFYLQGSEGGSYPEFGARHSPGRKIINDVISLSAHQPIHLGTL